MESSKTKEPLLDAMSLSYCKELKMLNLCKQFCEIYQDLRVITSSMIIADLAMTRGKEDVKRVLERQKMTEEAQTLQKFLNKKDELDQEINREIEELKLMSDNCEGDIDIIGM